MAVRAVAQGPMITRLVAGVALAVVVVAVSVAAVVPEVAVVKAAAMEQKVEGPVVTPLRAVGEAMVEPRMAVGVSAVVGPPLVPMEAADRRPVWPPTPAFLQPQII